MLRRLEICGGEAEAEGGTKLRPSRCERYQRRENSTAIHRLAQTCESFGCAKIAASMKPIAEILGSALRRAGRRGSAMSWLAGAWPVIVGAKLGERTRPQKLFDGVLDVTVTGKEWRAELEGVAAEFAGRVNAAWGGSLVKQVRFAAARRPGPRLPRSLDNEHTPFVRTGCSSSPRDASRKPPGEGGRS
jgi:predicted nucleic acid-binding Zn ribbon protein